MNAAAFHGEADLPIVMMFRCSVGGRMTIRWKQALMQGSVAAVLLLFLYWIPTWRPRMEYGWFFRAIDAVCKSCNTMPEDAVIAMLDGDRTLWHTCLKIEGRDPSPALLVRVRSLDKKIVPASQCTRSDATGFRTPDGKQAMLVSLHDWRRVSLTRATMSTASVPGFILGGSGWTCDLYRFNGTWMIDDCHMEWIS